MYCRRIFMISKKYFRIKKNGEPYGECFCRHPELIENYELAIADNTQIWECHHRLETHNSDGERRSVEITEEELKALGMYFDRPPEELIFLNGFEHNSLHNKGKKKSKEHRQKIGNSLKGKFINREDESKPVLCVETGKVFQSISEAYRQTGANRVNISKVLSGKRKTAGGFHWQYA